MRKISWLAFALVFLRLCSDRGQAQEPDRWIGVYVFDPTKAEADQLGCNTLRGAKIGVIARLLLRFAVGVNDAV